MFTNSSTFSNSVDTAFLYTTVLSAIVLIGIITAMIYFVVKYSRNKNPVPKNIEGNTTLEVTWTLVPLVLFMSMFYFGWEGYRDMRNIPKDAMVIKVTARMWQWSFEYPNGLQTDTLYVPVGRAIRGDLHSMDVNHAFYIPAFRVKRDVLPNKANNVWFKSEKTGVYDIACAEYCGMKHSYMYTKIYVMEQKDYDTWYANASRKAGKIATRDTVGTKTTTAPASSAKF
ncbi:MAG TPA: cytochrome c oxidase subunit II [Bacteroidota bacterium]|nr:cytochrome c oxidase subunit II [Bacteroidota bacterium]